MPIFRRRKFTRTSIGIISGPCTRAFTPEPSLPSMTVPAEVWLRGPVDGVQPLLQPAAHAILQVGEDIPPIVADLTADRLWARPAGAAAIGFHLLHLPGSLDRLLT